MDFGVMGCRSNGSSDLWAVGIKTRTPFIHGRCTEL